MKRAARIAAALVLAAACLAATAHAARKPRKPKVVPQAPVVDSVTVALWHFDENGGTRAADAGTFRLDGIAGLDTRTDFGRYGAARIFSRSADSFVYVPASPELEAPRAGFTIEAWVRVDSVATYELQVIAARWTPISNQQDWVFGVTGLNAGPPIAPYVSPGWFRNATGFAPAQRLVFAYQPLMASAMRGFTSTADLPIGRWVHVAAAVDGSVVRLYVDGRLDGTFATTGPIRPSDAPLWIGNVYDPRHLTSFGSDLRADPNANVFAWYPFVGAIDELRLSGVARAVDDRPSGR
jgi:hypothetical protein